MEKIKGKFGFIVKGKFYSNDKGCGHEANARDIIDKFKWTKEWNGGEAQEFIVMEKGAIQIGSGTHYPTTIVVSRKFYNESKMEKIKKKYHLEDYSCDFVNY
ncbi:MAG: hypothetical protein IJ890_08795 [Clostridia bacterium]|nr:hypothetical protein [Clostridia bacterium]